MSDARELLLPYRRHYTYAQLEAMLGISRGTLCDIVKGKPVSRRTTNRLRLALGYPPKGKTLRDLPTPTLSWLIQHRRAV